MSWSLFDDLPEPNAVPPAATDVGAAARPLSVAQLTALVKDVLESSFPRVWVTGEISNFSRPQSGHCYFTLKDESAQVRAVLWRPVAQRVRVPLRDGLQVVCQGELEVYAPRGSYQLVVRHLEPAGLGAMELALRKLRERLAAEGLFARERKRPLPPFPRRVAFVTSPTGAAIRDFLEVLRRRWRGADVLVVPVRVQGDAAAAEIVEGLRRAGQVRPAVDVIVVGRGGGSLEDLWCFNDERVVRAIHAAPVPVVSAVGHEIDVTLADLVADVRALTPSEAAERVVPSEDAVRSLLADRRQRLAAALRARAETARARLDALASRRPFRRPFERLREWTQRLDESRARMDRATGHTLAARRQILATLAGRLDALSPLGVLARGYSLTQRADNGRLLRAAGEVQPGERIVTRLGRGRVSSTVDAIELE